MQIIASLRELWLYRRLVKQLAVRDLKARYKVSVLGFFWSLLRPLLTVVVLAAVFSTLLDFESDCYAVPYYILLLATYMPWFYFSTALLEGVHSLLANANLVQKVYCPRSVFPASVVLANLVNFLLSLIVVVPIIYLLCGARPTFAFLQLPLIIAMHTAFLFGLCLIVSVLNVLYRDTTQVMEFLVFVWFYLSPVLYDVTQVHEKLSGLTFLLYFVNPMAGILEWYRYVILASEHVFTSKGSVDFAIQNQYVTIGIAYAVLASLLTFAFGLYLHKKLENRAVDTL